jgi:hypothetical protein
VCPLSFIHVTSFIIPETKEEDENACKTDKRVDTHTPFAGNVKSISTYMRADCQNHVLSMKQTWIGGRKGEGDGGNDVFDKSPPFPLTSFASIVEKKTR